jgi:hypothetical protein
MQTSLDAGRGWAVGSHVIMTERMLGVDLSLEEVVREREPPRRKEMGDHRVTPASRHKRLPPRLRNRIGGQTG